MHGVEPRRPDDARRALLIASVDSGDAGVGRVVSGLTEDGHRQAWRLQAAVKLVDLAGAVGAEVGFSAGHDADDGHGLVVGAGRSIYRFDTVDPATLPGAEPADGPTPARHLRAAS